MRTFNNQNSSIQNQLHNKLRHGFISFPILLLSFLLFSSMAEAQRDVPPPPDQFYTARFSPSMAIIIVILIAALFFMGFFSIYIRHCNQNPTGQTIRQTISMRRRGVAAARGLDASVIETFPTFSYAEVKDQRIGKGALECAVCLNEFEDDETLRLIPKCDHVFHPECIDAWLESHVTCPVCRADLGPVQDEPAQVPAQEVAEVAAPVLEEQSEGSVHAQLPRSDEVSIRVDAEEEEQNARPVANPGLIHSGSLNRAPRSWSIRRPKMLSFGKFRSHSTGHSLVVPGENLDRFTLRLPEGVRKEMLNRALLNRNESCARTLQRDGSTRGGSRAGDGSNRGVRFTNRRIDIPDRGAKSDRWGFFTRGLSMKSPKVVDNGSGSTSNSKSPKTAVKYPSFKCLEPKSSDEMETSLVRSDSARPPV